MVFHMLFLECIFNSQFSNKLIVNDNLGVDIVVFSGQIQTFASQA